MPKLNLRKQIVVDDNHGNPKGFGPGETEVPDWAIKKLLAQRGIDPDKATTKDVTKLKNIVVADNPKEATKPADKPAQS